MEWSELRAECARIQQVAGPAVVAGPVLVLVVAGPVVVIVVAGPVVVLVVAGPVVHDHDLVCSRLAVFL